MKFFTVENLRAAALLAVVVVSGYFGSVSMSDSIRRDTEETQKRQGEILQKLQTVTDTIAARQKGAIELLSRQNEEAIQLIKDLGKDRFYGSEGKELRERVEKLEKR